MPNVPVTNMNVTGTLRGWPAPSASAFSNRSVIADVSSTTTIASNGSGAAGANRTVALLSANPNCPDTGAPAMVTRNESGVIVAGAIGSVKVARMSVPTGTFTEPWAGTIAETRGGTTSGDLVLKLAVS